MGLETGSFVEDLVSSNPPGGDSKSQGDDHLRLIKTVLRGTFKRATKAFSFPGSVAKSANYTVLSTDDGLTILCDTTSQFTLTLPTLASGDAGWNVFVVKTTTDANPIFIAPPSGTINGYSKVRRSVEFVATRVLWTGSAYVVTRPFGTPIGSTVDFHGSVLPNGHLWADGATFTAADYVELNSVLGGNTKPDLRGRSSFGRDNMGVGAASRLTNTALSGITGSTLGSSGGAETNTLPASALPAHTHSGTTGNQNANHTHGGTTGAGSPHQHDAFIGDDGHIHPNTTPGVLAAGGAGIGGANNSGALTNSGNSGSNGTGIKVRSSAGNAASADNQTGTESAHVHGFLTSGVSADHQHNFTTDNGTGGAGAHNNLPPALIVNKIVVAE